MTPREKKEIARSLDLFVQKMGSQAKAAKAMGIGATTVNAVLKYNFNEVSDEMLRRIESYTRPRGTWELVETAGYREITEVLNQAKDQCGVTWLTAEAGSGKSSTARQYAEEERSVYYILCNEDMRKREFLDAICRAIGVYGYTRTLATQMQDIVEKLRTKERPLLIFDEADKLSDRLLLYFVQLYNELEDRAGMVLMSTPQIHLRMERGLRYQKRGYAELNSRIGRRFYRVDRTTPVDVYAICKANGITDEKVITAIVKDADDYDLDLRRVKKLVQARRK